MIDFNEERIMKNEEFLFGSATLADTCDVATLVFLLVDDSLYHLLQR